jgi:hypothetical protein
MDCVMDLDFVGNRRGRDGDFVMERVVREKRSRCEARST